MVSDHYVHRIPKHRFTNYSKSLIDAKTIVKKDKTPLECKEVNVSTVIKNKKLEMLYPNLKCVLRSKSTVGFPQA